MTFSTHIVTPGVPFILRSAAETLTRLAALCAPIVRQYIYTYIDICIGIFIYMCRYMNSNLREIIVLIKST